MEFSAQQIAGFLNGTIEGDPNVKVSNFSKIEEGKPGTLTFLANLKYAHHIYNTEASIVLVNNDFKPEQPIKATLVKVENAYAALAMLLNLVEQSKSKKKGVDSTAFIAASATVSDDCYVGNFAYIGEGVKMGKNCPYESGSSRSDMKELLRSLEAINPEARYSLWGSMTNIQEDYLPRKIR